MYDKAVRGVSHRCDGHASIVLVARMRETESLRRHAHVPEPCRKFRSESGDRGRRRVADFPGPLAPHPACPRGGGVERVQVPISHNDMRKETLFKKCKNG